MKLFAVVCVIFAILGALTAWPLSNADAKKCLKKNGVFPKSGSNCLSYYECKNWVPTEKKCPPKQHFDATLGWCDREEMYPCLERPINKVCLEPNGKFLKQGTNCKKYIDCCEGEPTEKSCPPGEMFDVRKGICEYQHLHVCLEDIPSYTEEIIDVSTKEAILYSSLSTKTKPTSPNNLLTLSSTVAPLLTESFENTATFPKSTLTPIFNIITKAENETDGDNATKENYVTDKIFASTEHKNRITVDQDNIKSTEPDDGTTKNQNKESTIKENETTINQNDKRVTKLENESTDVSINRESKFTQSSTLKISSITEIHISSSNNLPSETLGNFFTSSKTTQIFDTSSDFKDYSSTTTDSITTLPTVQSKTPSTSTSLTSIPLDVTTTINDEQIVATFMCPEPHGYFPHPTNKHKFIGCVNSYPSILTCPHNLIYVHKKRRCNYE